MQDLQSIINQRAVTKLEKEIKENKLKFLGHINYQEFITEFPGEKYNWQLDSILSFSNTPGIWIFSKIKEKLLPQYIENETILFLKEIEELKARVAELNEDVSFLQTA